MNRNYVFMNMNEALPSMLSEVLKHGDELGSRNGRVKELTHVGITLREPWRRELTVPHRNANVAAQIAETVWVLSGRNDVEWLGHYLPRAKDFSDDGETWRGGYGPRLRGWRLFNGQKVDQLRHVFELLTADRSSRQAVMSIYDPAIDTEPGKDIPCNNWLSFSSRLGYLDLHVAIRSNDAMWGWSGINAFEWSALQEVMAGLLGVRVGSLHFSTTSFHLYDQHWAKAQRIAEHSEQDRIPLKDSPRFNGDAVGRSVELLDQTLADWMELEEAIRAGKIVDQEVDAFPEPMLQSWLRVLQWWWTGELEYLSPLEGTALEVAARTGLQPPFEREVTELLADGTVVGRVISSEPEPIQQRPENTNEFIKFATELHDEKHAAYGDSWKRRGEMLGILANIARKVDRLGGSETSDETSADTAIDLMVYLAKYRMWLEDPKFTDATDSINTLIKEIGEQLSLPMPVDVEASAEYLRLSFDRLEEMVNEDKPRANHVGSMLVEAYRLAHELWSRAQEHDGDDYRGADVD